jgi:hypothetical protein
MTMNKVEKERKGIVFVLDNIQIKKRKIKNYKTFRK